MRSPGSIRLPVGVRDFLPAAAEQRRQLADELLDQFAGWGYRRLLTPAFEVADVLERGLGDDASAAAIRFVEPVTGEVVALRPDITPQVARVVATRFAEVRGPLRFCYEGAVTRIGTGHRPQQEIMQAGVELFGVAAPAGDAEVLALACAALRAAGHRAFKLDIGHGGLARRALLQIADRDQRARVQQRLLKRDRGGVEREADGLPAAVRTRLVALPTLYGEPESVLSRAADLVAGDREVAAAVAMVRTVLGQLRDVLPGGARPDIAVDFGEVRGFDYYTGVRFAAYVDGAGDAVLQGGRYDRLVGQYGGARPATGFAVDVEALAEAAVAPTATKRPRVLVAGVGDSAHAYAIAAQLRRKGCQVAVDPRARLSETGAQRHARATGFGAVLWLGKSPAIRGQERVAVAKSWLAEAARGDARKLWRALKENCS